MKPSTIDLATAMRPFVGPLAQSHVDMNEMKIHTDLGDFEDTCSAGEMFLANAFKDMVTVSGERTVCDTIIHAYSTAWQTDDSRERPVATKASTPTYRAFDRAILSVLHDIQDHRTLDRDELNAIMRSAWMDEYTKAMHTSTAGAAALVHQFIHRSSPTSVVSNEQEVKRARLCLAEFHANVAHSLYRAYKLACVEALILTRFLNTAEDLIKWPRSANPFEASDPAPAPAPQPVPVAEQRTPPQRHFVSHGMLADPYHENCRHCKKRKTTDDDGDPILSAEDRHDLAL